MPHIGRLAASIVTSPIAALHTQHHYAEAIPSHGAVFSDHFHFHVSHDERSHIVRVRPGFWWFRQDLNLRIPPGAVLYQLSYETMLRWAVRTHRATGKELKVKTGSDTGGRRVLSRQLHSSIFRQVDTMGFSYFRNVLHKIPPPPFSATPRGSTGIAPRSCTASSWRGRGDVCI